ncbi:tetratricopeptide repeat protein [Cupriavidus sp. AU9028]|uniref:tetratricopeptide repeat protein n=1 Tax=Cupriavidus sp. AU9028 TaxID=2871157 RepID=UPI001C964330|nr:tetratricopeptide repeat protein [Cupriavidus sp. AU9028]MBY4898761.1 tetratricopeptide repeat protein [Cupriavidus sp. AU9028]
MSPTSSLVSPLSFSAVRRSGALVLSGVAVALCCMLASEPAPAQDSLLGLPANAPTGYHPSAQPGMAEAEQAAVQRRYDEAIQRYDKVIAENPRNVQARFQRAWALAQAGRDDDAVRAFTELAQDYPELPETHNNLALLYARQGDLKRAEAELLLAVQARPGFAIGFSNLGDVYRRLAEQSYAQALKLNPGDARASRGLAAVRDTASATAKPAPAAQAPAAAKPQPAPRKAPELPSAPGPQRPDLD